MSRNDNIWGHVDDNVVVDQPDYEFGLSDNRVVREASPFYSPWIGAGLRVELRSIKGVTRKGMLQVPFRFQVPPLDSFRVDKAVVATDYSTIQEGTFTRLNGKELATVTFDTLVTQEPAPWVIARGLWNPHRVSRRLADIHDAETPFRLVAWHPGPIIELNMPVTFRNLGKEERAGENDARYLSPSFTQWRDPVIERRQIKNWPRRHKLDQNDTLSNLARDYWHKAGEGGYLGMTIDHLSGWGVRQPIVKNKHYNVGDVIEIPEPPHIGLSERRRAA